MEQTGIRAYRPSDWSRLCAIHDAARQNELALAGLSEAFVPLETAAVSEGLFDYRLAVACLGENPVAFCACSEGELAWLYVDPAYARRGIGKSLVQEALSHIPNRPVTAEVLLGNTPALRLYESCGFRVVDTPSGVMPGNEAFPVTVWALERE